LTIWRKKFKLQYIFTQSLGVFFGEIEEHQTEFEGFLAQLNVRSVVGAHSNFELVVLWEPFELASFEAEDSIADLMQQNDIVISIDIFGDASYATHGAESPVEMKHFRNQRPRRKSFFVVNFSVVFNLLQKGCSKDGSAVQVIDDSFQTRFIIVESSSAFQVSSDVISTFRFISVECC